MRECLVKATFIRGNALQRYILRSYQTTHSVLTRNVFSSSRITIILPSATHRRAGSQSVHTHHTHPPCSADALPRTPHSARKICQSPVPLTSSFDYSEQIVKFAARNKKYRMIMEATNTTFNRPSHEEVRQMLLRAKARQQQLEEEGKRMWENNHSESSLTKY